MLAIFTGFDSAWYPGKTGAICDLVLQGDSLLLAAPPIPATWDCAMERARKQAEVDLRVWAIDQPLVVRNEQGCRPVDIDLMRALMRDFQVGAHTANLNRPPWLPSAPIWQFLTALEDAGYRQDPMAVPHAASGRFFFECYPHPALIGLFDLDRILRYKKRNAAPGDWMRLVDAVRSLASSDFPISNITDYVYTDLSHSKRDEDMLDSIVCAYIAAYWWRFGVARSSVIGNPSSGYMVTPHSPRTLAALERVFHDQMNERRPAINSSEGWSRDRSPMPKPIKQEHSAASIRGPYDWVYFAADSKWNLDGFCEFVATQKLIVRTIHNQAGIPVPNVGQLKAGERILLVYKAEGKPYRQLFACTIGRSPAPIQTRRHRFEVFSRIDASRFNQELKDAGFDSDPVAGGFTGICLSGAEDLHRAEIHLTKRIPMMTIQRWADVFPTEGT